jgi:hypothetical protein
MQTAPNNSMEMFGILHPDGTIRLDHPPEMAPGPVQITIRSVAQLGDRVPDFPIDDPSVLPPLDLPRMGITQIVHPIPVTQRLPDPIDSAEAN